MLEEKGYTNIIVPQEKPRSTGEVLGCTSPNLQVDEDNKNNNIVISICDGRFHLESVMIANPKFQFFQYNPYTKTLTSEFYSTEEMKLQRKKAITLASKGKTCCICLGILGRQGSPKILERIEEALTAKKIEYFVLLVSEIDFQQLENFEEFEILL